MKGSLRSATRARRRAATGLGFDLDPVIRCGTNALLTAEVSLRRLDRDMSKQELDLLQFAARSMGYPSTGPTVVTRQFFDTCIAGVLADHVPDCLFRQAVTASLPVLVN